MSTPGFWRQAAAGFVLSLVAAVAYSALAPMLGGALVARGLIVGLGAAYLALLMPSLEARVGRVVVIAAWLGVTLALFAFDPHLGLWLLAEVVLIWLVRCLYRYDSLVGAFADAALCAFAVATAVAVAGHTRSVFLTVWAFFLVQALFVLVPIRRRGADAVDDDVDDAFGQAWRTAEAALRRMSVRS